MDTDALVANGRRLRDAFEPMAAAVYFILGPWCVALRDPGGHPQSSRTVSGR